MIKTKLKKSCYNAMISKAVTITMSSFDNIGVMGNRLSKTRMLRRDITADTEALEYGILADVPEKSPPVPM